MDESVIFNNIVQNCLNYCRYSNDKSCVLSGDSIEVIKNIPDNSVSLILTDHPYHSTKKKNIYGDTFFREDQEYLGLL